LESEFHFWTENRMVTFEKDGKSYRMARYNAPSRGPRPESYRFVLDERLVVTKDYYKQVPIYIDIERTTKLLKSLTLKMRKMTCILGLSLAPNLGGTIRVDGL